MRHGRRFHAKNRQRPGDFDRPLEITGQAFARATPYPITPAATVRLPDNAVALDLVRDPASTGPRGSPAEAKRPRAVKIPGEARSRRRKLQFQRLVPHPVTDGAST